MNLATLIQPFINSPPTLPTNRDRLSLRKRGGEGGEFYLRQDMHNKVYNYTKYGL